MCPGKTLLALVALLMFIGCADRAFQFSEDSAMNHLMATKHVAALEREIPNRRLMCMVENTSADAIYLYLGDDEGDHTPRVGFYRVTRDGLVWVNQDETGLDHQWKVIE